MNTQLSLNGYKIKVKRLPAQDTGTHQRWQYELTTPDGTRLFGTPQDNLGLQIGESYARDMVCYYALRLAAKGWDRLADSVRREYAPIERKWAESLEAKRLSEQVDALIVMIEENINEYHLLKV